MGTNEKIVDWITAKAKRDYSEDIALILAYGSYINGTANEKSDVDCYFIPKTQRGYSFGADFILNGIGYDIFPMSWQRVENIANLKDHLSPCVGDVRVLFYSTDEDLERFKALQSKLRSNLCDREYTQKVAGERFADACALYSKMKNSKSLCETRKYGGIIIMTLADVLAVYNNDYFHFGLKTQYEDLQKLKNKPKTFVQNYANVIESRNRGEAENYCHELLKTVSEYMGFELIIERRQEEENAPVQDICTDYNVLAGLYEEISSTFNKIYVCSESGNYILAFLSAVCLQNVLTEVLEQEGIPCYDVLSSYDCRDLTPLAAAARRAENELVQIIENGGGKIKSFDTFEDFERANL